MSALFLPFWLDLFFHRRELKFTPVSMILFNLAGQFMYKYQKLLFITLDGQIDMFNSNYSVKHFRYQKSSFAELIHTDNILN